LNLPEWLTAERYQARNSFLHRRDPRAKIILTLAAAFAVTLIPEGSWGVFGAIAAVVLSYAALSKLPVGFFIRRVGIALPFLLAAVPLLFTRPGETLFTMPLVGWTASDEGLVAVISILLKSALAVIMATALIGTTAPTDLLRALERMRVPRLLSSTVMLMYRYVFLIAEEGQRMMRARDSRSAAARGLRSGRNATWRAGILGRMVGSLFLRSYERSERVYTAMAARGFDGSIRIVREESSFDMLDWVTLFGVVFVLVGIVTYVQL
jgi:cobalt/nickel transport system permease protein